MLLLVFLRTTVCLDTLNRERELFHHSILKKVDRVGGSTCTIQIEHAQVSAIINGRILETARSDLHGIKLNPITRQWPVVPPHGIRRTPPEEWRASMARSTFQIVAVTKTMLPQQFSLNPLWTKFRSSRNAKIRLIRSGVTVRHG